MRYITNDLTIAEILLYLGQILPHMHQVMYLRDLQQEFPIAFNACCKLPVKLLDQVLYRV